MSRSHDPRNESMRLLAVFLASALALTCAVSSRAALPIKSKQMLEQEASHVLAGKIVRIVETRKPSGPSEVLVSVVAHLAVFAVLKGEEVRLGDEVPIRYWYSQWLPPALPSPGDHGHYNRPAEGNEVLVYLTGTLANGLAVIRPNGFAK